VFLPYRYRPFDLFFGGVHGVLSGRHCLCPLRIGLRSVVRRKECVEKFHPAMRCAKPNTAGDRSRASTDADIYTATKTGTLVGPALSSGLPLSDRASMSGRRPWCSPGFVGSLRSGRQPPWRRFHANSSQTRELGLSASQQPLRYVVSPIGLCRRSMRRGLQVGTEYHELAKA
jgi:hypothetical protein